MDWNKAGRPKSKDKEKPYTREELTLNKDPVKALARAVIKQWKEDGCPEDDKPGIAPWIGILKINKR